MRLVRLAYLAAALAGTAAGAQSLFDSGPAAFTALPVKIPLLLGQPAEIGFNIANVRKDLRTIAAFAEQSHAARRTAK